MTVVMSPDTRVQTGARLAGARLAEKVWRKKNLSFSMFVWHGVMISGRPREKRLPLNPNPDPDPNLNPNPDPDPNPNPDPNPDPNPT